eukprot:155099-Pleurochrysis_carterae.AAC.1
MARPAVTVWTMMAAASSTTASDGFCAAAYVAITGVVGAATSNNFGMAGTVGGFDGKPGVSLMHLIVSHSLIFGYWREAEALVYAADMGPLLHSNLHSHLHSYFQMK